MEFKDHKIEIPADATGEVRAICPECTPHRKPEHQNEKDLSVNVDEGTWYCHHCGWSGGLKQKENTYEKPEYNPSELTKGVIQFFANRGISQRTLNKGNIGFCKEKRVITFPRYKNNEIVAVKYRTHDKRMWQSKNPMSCFFNYDNAKKIGSDYLIITEGEIDALSFIEAHIENVASVPDGAPSPTAKNLENKLSFLQDGLIDKYKYFVLAVDNDEPGKFLEQKLAEKLGKSVCYRIDYPLNCKDPNDVLIKHGPDKLKEIYKNAQPYPIDGLFTANDVYNAVAELYDKGLQPGVSTGWDSINELYTVRGCEMTVVTGTPGSGKSTWLDALTVNLNQSHGWKIAYCSPENWPIQRHISGILEKITCKPFARTTPTETRMSEEERDKAIQEMSKNFFFTELPEEQMSLDSILDVMQAAVSRYNVQGVVLDPWNELEYHRPTDLTETEFVSRSLGKIRRFARLNNVHVWIVAHPTKLRKNDDGSYPVPRLYDISGCHSEDTEVMTLQGWKLHSDIGLDDYVACFDPKTDTLSYMKPEKIWEYNYTGEMYHYKGSRFDALVTPHHRMLVKPIWGTQHTPVNSGHGRPFKYDRDAWNFTEARHAIGRLEMPWSCPFTGGDDIRVIGDYDAELMMQFIGWYIAEGWFNRVSKGIGICQGVGRLQKKMREVMKKAGIHYTEAIGQPGTGGYINGWKAYIGVKQNRDLCKWIPEECGVGSKNKKIPNFVWSLSSRLKKVLLWALIETDGSKNGPDTYRYSTTSPQLADDVQRLSIECGRMATISSKTRSQENHNPQYQVNVGSESRKRQGFSSYRHLTKYHYDGKVYCLTVPTGAYLVRRNGKPGIYGNSAHWYNKTDNGICVHREDQKKDMVDIYVQKIRFKEVGQLGEARLKFVRDSGIFLELTEKDQQEIQQNKKQSVAPF